MHIIAPIVYLVLSIAWGYFFTTKTLWDNVTDNLCILAIWYIGISVLWFFSINYLDGQAEKIQKKLKANIVIINNDFSKPTGDCETLHLK